MIWLFFAGFIIIFSIIFYHFVSKPNEIILPEETNQQKYTYMIPRKKI